MKIILYKKVQDLVTNFDQVVGFPIELLIYSYVYVNSE